MGEADTRQAEERIDTAEKRLAALHDLGIDTGALRSQLAFARTCVSEGNLGDVGTLCDEVLAAARRLADGVTSGASSKTRTDRYTRDQLGEAVRAQLSQGLFAKLLAEHTGENPRLEARLQALEAGVAARLADAESALSTARMMVQNDVATLRAELQRSVDLITGMRHDADASSADASRTASALERFAAQAAEQQERLLTTLSGSLERVGSALIARPEGVPSAASQVAGEPSSTQALQTGLARIADAISQRPAAKPVGTPPRGPHAPLIDTQALDAPDHVAEILERFAGLAAQQQERLLQALSNGLEQLGAVLATRPSGSTQDPSVQDALQRGFAQLAEAISQRPAAPVADTQREVAGGAQVAEQQGAMLATLTTGLEKLAGALAQRGTVPVLAHVDPSASVSAALVQGFEQLIAELAQRRNSALEPSRRVATDAGEGPMFEHETTRVFQSVSTRTDKPAVQAPLPLPEPSTTVTSTSAAAHDARMLDTGRVRRLVADEVGQQITDRQGGAEPITIYDPEQVRLQVVAEVNRILAGRVEASAGEPVKEAELSRLLSGLLPTMLTAEPVRRALFSMIALEAVSNPGALGELTGLRAFLRHELALAAEDMTRDAQPA